VAGKGRVSLVRRLTAEQIDQVEKFLASIVRRWTFMEHMELPAYWDRS
jgi:hypothetical protein